MCMDNAQALNIVTTEPQFLLLHYYFYYLQLGMLNGNRKTGNRF